MVKSSKLGKLVRGPIGIVIILMVLLFGNACRKQEVYPIEPAISFYKFTKIATENGIDSKGILSLNFTDGDGDIGLKEDDTLAPYNYGSPYYYNFYIDYYEKQNDTFVKVELPFTNNSRIPFVKADLAERGIKGTIEIELFINNILSTHDTIMFKAFIYDRALHKSNWAETPEIVIKKK